MAAGRIAAGAPPLAWALIALLSAIGLAAISSAQDPLQEPIHWGHHGLMIPYRWTSSAESRGASEVVLYVSRARGADWAKIASAAPNVRSFQYQAPGDGEYWFAIRTYTADGRFEPAGPLQPEMRVLVDTVAPVVGRFAGVLSSGELRVVLEARDETALDPASVRLYTQAEGRGGWTPTQLSVSAMSQGGLVAQAVARPASGASRVALRVVVADRAGNRTESSAVASSADPFAPQAQPNPYAVAAGGYAGGEPGAPLLPDPRQGVSGPALANPFDAFGPTDLRPPTLGVAADQTRPVSVPPSPSATAGFPSARSGWGATEAADGLAAAPSNSPMGWPSDTPAAAPLVVAPFAPWPDASPSAPVGETRPDAQNSFARADAVESENPGGGGLASSPSEGRPRSNPFSTTSLSRPTESSGEGPEGATDDFWDAPSGAPGRRSRAEGWDALNGPGEPTTGRGPDRVVNAKEFEFEYELSKTGRWGVARVELWGTADGGRTWRRFAVDADRQSPVRVATPGEGEYGFRILVEAVGGLEPTPPRPGDQPDVTVRVDLTTPRVVLTRVEQGEGYFADQLRIDWRAEDENPTPAPIDLLYSNRPTGPWLPIATGLANSGTHSWRLQRHLPARLYLRVEARDAGGNVGAATTSDPIEIDVPQPTANLRAVRPLGGP